MHQKKIPSLPHGRERTQSRMFLYCLFIRGASHSNTPFGSVFTDESQNCMIIICGYGYYQICSSPPIRRVSSSIRSIGNGGDDTGFIAIDISFTGLSSAAIRFELNVPQILQRWTIAHSPCFLTHTAIGSIVPPQSAARSPGSLSRCLLDRQYGQ